MKTLTYIIMTSLALLCSVGCNRSVTKQATVVAPFDQQKYLGTWYEIARMDYHYEKNLNNVSATYSSPGCSGKIIVDNKGYDTKELKWKESVGIAKTVGKSPTG